ncbi:hypothetical protein ALI44B_11425 [Leifsonia sp. ALI-44-B]|nr:hypothetical protein ALI44B_11425 [Leifsonia sp. ALI-44-B]
MNERMDHADWDGILGTIKEAPLRERVHTGPTRTLIGEVLSVDGELHLKLMLVRDEDAWLDVYNPEAQSLTELDLDDVERLVETSIVAFLSFGNIFGIIQGSTTAPTPTALVEWMSGLRLFGEGVILEAQALVSHEAQELIRRSAEATQIEVKMHTNQADALQRRGSKLSDILRTVKEEYGPMTVTVILSASKARDQTDGREAIHKEAGIIADASDNNEVAKAKAKLIFFDPDETSHSQEVDFAKQKITAKRKIATTAEDGSPIRNTSAVRAILQVAQENAEELKAIVDVT